MRDARRADPRLRSPPPRGGLRCPRGPGAGVWDLDSAQPNSPETLPFSLIQLSPLTPQILTAPTEHLTGKVKSPFAKVCGCSRQQPSQSPKIEADKVTEEPHTTMDAKKHPSSKDPSTEDLQEPPLSETTLEPSISQIPLEAQASESLLEHSVSEPPLDKSTFKTLLEPHTSENPLEPSIYVTSLKESASMVPLEAPTFETHNSEVPEKHIAFQSSPVNQLSSSDTLSDDDLSESSSTEVSWTRTSSQELFPKHFVSGPSAQNHMDTSTKQKEDSGENKEGMDTNDITAQTAHPEHQLGKKKEKKGVGRYIGSPVVPAKQAELMDLTKEMEREKSGAQLNHLFQWEKDASLNAIQTGRRVRDE
ncbi:Hypothetical predicted protein [Marmota monax]|uniref:Uncharacterized protein n=1 Tax=Marmota monax TaxID=9995 RepID=A0A5E4A6Z5_MARMO|nr:Hypothetical predicted protein [Marmota monax]